MEIGDKLYRYVEMSGLWTYTVIGVHQYESVQQYAVRSESCSHGWKCELLVAEDSKGKLKYVSMLNDHEDDDQEYWHTGDFTFYKTKAGAKTECYKHYIRKHEEAVSKAKKELAYRAKLLAEAKDALDTIRKG